MAEARPKKTDEERKAERRAKALAYTNDLRQSIAFVRQRFKEGKEQGKFSEQEDHCYSLCLEFLESQFSRFFTTSRTSSLSPSQDPYREKGASDSPASSPQGKRSPGGQPNHPGTTHRLYANPDEIIECDNFGDEDVSGLEDGPIRVRQEIRFLCYRYIIQYNIHTKRGKGGICLEGAQPDGTPPPSDPIQYGPDATALMVRLSTMEMLPCKREAELLGDYFDVPLSPATILHACARIYKLLVELGFVEWIKRSLAAVPLVHADETGINVNGIGAWLHTLTTGLLVWFYLSWKRGQEATDEAGILPAFKGIVVHDCWATYFNYADCGHAVCGAHILRDLKFIIEKDGMVWALHLRELLQEADHRVNQSATHCLSQEEYESIRRRGGF